ncbi:hypothetical protein [Larkinella soli]|uniref:hypothetical protein n=1 Tax=Larkinella soli TaxID=1770527 RepID=UPI000FFBFDC6|nr:hypothetical protein [Larkinella soli]
MRKPINLNSAQKRAILSDLMQGNTEPLLKLKKQTMEPYCLLFEACVYPPEDRVNPEERWPDDPVREIEVTFCYHGQDKNETVRYADRTYREVIDLREELQQRYFGAAFINLLLSKVVESKPLL